MKNLFLRALADSLKERGMSFSYATAISRLASGPVNAFKAGISDAQKLQRLNEVLERFFDLGTWRGVCDTIILTTVGGIITLPSTYQRLDGLGIPSLNQIVDIRSKGYAFSPGGLGPQNWSLSAVLLALDMGDNGSGQRQYQITGNTTNLDAMSFLGFARKRYSWVSDTATIVIPDSFQALRMGVLALGFEDEADYERAASKFDDALRVLNGNLDEFEPFNRQVQVETTMGMGSFFLVH